MSKKFPLFLTTVLGVCVAGLLILTVGLSSKWILVFTAFSFFPLLVIALRSFRRAVVAILIFSLSVLLDFNPLYRAGFGGVPISLTGLSLIVLYILWLFDAIKHKASMRIFPQTTIPLVLVVLWASLSFFVAFKQTYVLYRLTFVIEFFLIYFYFANFVTTRDDAVFLVRCIAITVLFSAFIAICQYVFPSSFNFSFMGYVNDPLKLRYGSAVISRAVGFLGHANSLSLYLGCWLIVILLFFMRSFNSLWRVIYLISLLTGSVALVLTFSRGGWLSLGVAAILLFGILLIKQQHRVHLKMLNAAIIGLLIAIVLAAPFANHIGRRLKKDDYNAARVRLTLARQAIQSIEKHPLMGVGLGGYEMENARFPWERGVVPVHNMYLHIIVELGVPAFLLCLWVFAVFFIRGMRAIDSVDIDLSFTALGFVCGLATIYVHGMFEPGTIGHPHLLPLAVIGGVLTSLGDNNRVLKGSDDL